jgi:hypothetical protein
LGHQPQAIRDLLIRALKDDKEWRTTMDPERAERLRNAARVAEEKILDDLADLSDVSFPLVRGGAKDFPRPAPEDQAAERGIDVLREDVEDAVAEVYAQAAVGKDLPESHALFTFVQPFIDALPVAEGQSTSENGPNQTEGNTTT